MCLYLKDRKFKVASRNLIVFKACRKIAPTMVTSVFYPQPYEQGYPAPKTFIGTMFNEDNKMYEVHEGYHSYRFFLTAWLSDDNNMYGLSETSLFIIPKGSRYLSGTHSAEALGYTSDQIVYIGSAWNPINWIKGLLWKRKQD